MTGCVRVRRIALLGLAFSVAIPVVVVAQSIRISGSTSLRYVELRPLVRDSVSVEQTQGNELLRQTADGRVVRCIPEDPFCHDVRPGDAVSTVPVIQDLEVSAWGFGEGMRLFTHLRGRTAWGSNPELWPRAEDAFDVLVAYGEFERERLRLRAGRQWKVSGLGFYNFDGVAVALRPAAGVWLEAYGGRSLVRGLNEPRTSGALESIEALAPVVAGLLLGVQARYRPDTRLALGALYQVDLRDDRLGLYSELAAADGVLRLGRASIEGSVELDVGARALNEARFRVRSPPLGRTTLQAEVRRYRPYFELWTIWGAFSPVGFDEARVGATWAAPHASLILRGEASYRSYGDTGMDDGLGGFQSDGWGLGAHVHWSPERHWRLEGGYRVETGFGAARREGQLGLVRELGESGSLALQGMAFQRLYEFRLQEGTVLGLGVETSLRVSERARLFAGVAGYRHLRDGAMNGMDWNQRRGSVRLQWTLGPEPGTPRGVGGGR
jgi:hypothetical protein